jgi:hypothetical protein
MVPAILIIVSTWPEAGCPFIVPGSNKRAICIADDCRSVKPSERSQEQCAVRNEGETSSGRTIRSHRNESGARIGPCWAVTRSFQPVHSRSSGGAVHGDSAYRILLVLIQYGSHRHFLQVANSVLPNQALR